MIGLNVALNGAFPYRGSLNPFFDVSSQVYKDIEKVLSPEMLLGIGNFLKDEIKAAEVEGDVMMMEGPGGKYIWDAFNDKRTWESIEQCEGENEVQSYLLLLSQLKLARYIGVIIPGISDKDMAGLDDIPNNMAVDYLNELIEDINTNSARDIKYDELETVQAYLNALEFGRKNNDTFMVSDRGYNYVEYQTFLQDELQNHYPQGSIQYNWSPHNGFNICIRDTEDALVDSRPRETMRWVSGKELIKVGEEFYYTISKGKIKKLDLESDGGVAILTTPNAAYFNN